MKMKVLHQGIQEEVAVLGTTVGVTNHTPDIKRMSDEDEI
jgi:hypothetical protein